MLMREFFEKSEIMIIGGGIVGVIIVYEFVKRGEEVIVIEKCFIGLGFIFCCGIGIR